MLTLKDLAQYLPYGIYCFANARQFGLEKPLCKKMDVYMLLNLVANDTEYKPAFYPLSMLTKEIEHNGERFVPIVRLLQITNFNGWFDKHNSGRYSEVDFNHEGWYAKAWVKYQANIDISIHTGFMHNVPHWIIIQLHQWHFWTGDQTYFEKGLIIDKSKQP